MPDRELSLVPISPEDARWPAAAALAHGGSPGWRIWSAQRGERLAAAIAVEILPGSVAILRPPRAVAGEPAASCRVLLEAVVAALTDQGVQLAQGIAEPDDDAARETFLAAGFCPAADVLYQVCLPAEFPETPPESDLEFESYSDAARSRLAAVLARTYVGTLDCPAIGPLRSLDDVLAGYRGEETSPANWSLVRHNGRDIGCLLLSPDRATGNRELTYMGLAPEARGQGRGLTIVRVAQWQARQAGARQLVLAVDAANWPALAVYRAAGFVTWSERRVLVRELGAP